MVSDGLLILGFLAVVLAPMALAAPSGSAVWGLITFLCLRGAEGSPLRLLVKTTGNIGSD
jgi:hypothetical protein